MDPCVHVVYVKLTLACKHFSNVLLINFGEPGQIVGSVSCSAGKSGTLCTRRIWQFRLYFFICNNIFSILCPW